MISEQQIGQQLVRLAVLRGAPDSATEVIFAFREAAKNPAHAARITGWLLRHQTFFPTPSEIYNAASQTLREDDLPQADAKCPSCGGTGYGQAWELVTHTDTPGGGSHKTVDVIRDPVIAAELRLKVDRKNQFLYDCAPRCKACSYGRALAIAEQQKEHAA